MTNRQPVTEAGRALLDDLKYLDQPEKAKLRILAIEAQASQLSEPRPAELVEALEQLELQALDSWPPDAAPVVHGLMQRVLAIVGAALAATDATAPDAEREK